MYWGAGRDCRYSGARKGIGAFMEYWGLLGHVGHVGEAIMGMLRASWGVKGVLGACRDCMYPGPEGIYGASWGIGEPLEGVGVLGLLTGHQECQKCIGGLAGNVGTQGPEEVYGTSWGMGGS